MRTTCPAGISCLSSRDPVKRLLDRLWKSHANEIAVRVQVVFAGFVDHAEQSVLLRKIIVDYPIELSQLQGRRIIIVAYANRKPMFLAGGARFSCRGAPPKHFSGDAPLRLQVPS